MTFSYGITPSSNLGREGWWFLFHEDRLLIRQQGESADIPLVADSGELDRLPIHRQFLGMLNETPCFTAELAEPLQFDNTAYRPLRSLLGVLSEEMFAVAGCAFQIMDWERSNRFCGRCGSQTQPAADERSMTCPACDIHFYPRISPAVIVAVVKDGRILLANSRRFQSVFFSVLAGFVEAGETFEECVHREIREEVGIEVKSLRYFGSQPWPFPNTLMVGFTAEYAGGDIVVEEKELVRAAWFDPEEVRGLNIPNNWTISRRLIDWFLTKYENCP